MRTMLPLAVSSVLAIAACSETPSSPSAIGAPSATGAADLRWDVVAAGCTPTTPPSPPPNAAAALVRIEGDGALVATWPVVSAGDRPATLYARFLPLQSGWALCSWDTVDQ